MPRNAAVPEVPFRLEITHGPVVRWTCSPDHPEALAVGWLVTSGYLEPDETPPAPAVHPDPDGGIRVRVTLTDAQLGRGREAGQEFGTDAPAAGERSSPPTPDAAAALFRALYAEPGRGRGGVHAAALSDGASLFFRTEEVGRHNAVDKVIGHALLAGRDPAGLGLIVSSRISGEIARKAARARLGWIASRSVPTTLALHAAGAAGIPILARAVGSEARLFAPQEAGG